MHNPFDRHLSHLAAFDISMRAVRSLKKEQRPRAIFGCEVWRDLDWLCDEDKVVLPVSKKPILALRLCRAFESQIAGGKRYDLAIMGRRRAHATFQESRDVDKERFVTLAVDLSELMASDEYNIQDFLATRLGRFSDSVKKDWKVFLPVF